MKCKKCGTDNGIVKKTCMNCNSILEGVTINNVTGEIGHRNADGSFTPYKQQEIENNSNLRHLVELKEEIKKLNKETWKKKK